MDVAVSWSPTGVPWWCNPSQSQGKWICYPKTAGNSSIARSAPEIAELSVLLKQIEALEGSTATQI